MRTKIDRNGNKWEQLAPHDIVREGDRFALRDSIMTKEPDQWPLAWPNDIGSRVDERLSAGSLFHFFRKETLIEADRGLRKIIT